jgi:hypothetical protein
MKEEKMRKWVIGFFAVALCISLAMPAWAADQGESVWAKYNMKLYGRVKVDYKYLDGRSTSTSVAYNMVDKMTTPDYNNDSTNFTAKDTRFGFIASHAAGEWAAQGRFEMDMFGNQAGNTTDPRFRLGYVNLANNDWGTSFRAGQDWNAIAQMNPSTIDFGILGHAGNLWERTVQFTIRQQLADNSLELLVSAFRFASTSTGSETRMPWVGARAAYTFEAFGGKHLVAVNGAYEKDKNDITKDDFDRWLVAAEFKLGLGPVLLKGEVWTGEAIDGAFTRDGSVATINSGNSTEEIAGWGGWVDATYKIMPEWSVTAGFGVDTPDKNDFKVNGVRAHMGNNAYSQNRNIYVNTWYTIFPDLKVGAEWMHVSTERVQGSADPNPGHDYTSSFNQIIASVFYNF